MSDSKQFKPLSERQRGKYCLFHLKRVHFFLFHKFACDFVKKNTIENYKFLYKKIYHRRRF